MSQFFAKIFQSIYDSSIAEDWRVRVVFQDMLILADADGVVDVTPESLSRRTNLPLDMVRGAIPKLESPDPSSRTPDHDGRRIVRLDAHRAWGWRIVNFAKYRESASRDMLRMAEAERKRAYRAKYGKTPSPTPPTEREQIKNEIQTCPRTVPDALGHVPDTDKGSPPVASLPLFKKPTLEIVKLQAAKIGLPDAEAEKLFAYYESNGWKVGKNPMRSLNAAMSGWKIRWQEKLKPQPQRKPQRPTPTTF